MTTRKGENRLTRPVLRATSSLIGRPSADPPPEGGVSGPVVSRWSPTCSSACSSTGRGPCPGSAGSAAPEPTESCGAAVGARGRDGDRIGADGSGGAGTSPRLRTLAHGQIRRGSRLPLRVGRGRSQSDDDAAGLFGLRVGLTDGHGRAADRVDQPRGSAKVAGAGEPAPAGRRVPGAPCGTPWTTPCTEATGGRTAGSSPTTPESSEPCRAAARGRLGDRDGCGRDRPAEGRFLARRR